MAALRHDQWGQLTRGSAKSLGLIAYVLAALAVVALCGFFIYVATSYGESTARSTRT